MTIHLRILREDLTTWWRPDTSNQTMDMKPHAPLSHKDFAQAVTAMHGYAGPGELTEETIKDLEDPASTTKYPRVMLDEIMLFLGRCYRGGESRNFQVEDVPGLAARVEN